MRIRFAFWGKLNAWKHAVPLVVSTSTFAFNQMSSQYMKNSPAEMADMIFGLPRISKALKTLEPYGYHVKSVFSLIQSDNQTDSVVYTSRRFQPYVESFSDHYLFVGPSVFSTVPPAKENQRPLVYISMGTVINDCPDFYTNCIEALKTLDVDVVISCGKTMDIAKLGELPENVQVFPYVDQLDVLSRANVFLTHCGMNSVSESLYMATPMVLYPQTNEQKAVARRTQELSAGVPLSDESADGIRAAVQEILTHKSYSEAAWQCSADFRACAGPAGAAEFIENAPHTSDGVDILAELNKINGLFRLIYWLFFAACIVLFGVFVGWKWAWIPGLTAGLLQNVASKVVQKSVYAALCKKYRR